MTADSPSQPDLLDEVLAAYLRAIEGSENPRTGFSFSHPANQDLQYPSRGPLLRCPENWSVVL